MKSFKIAVVYHKKDTLVYSEDFLPVNAGRAVAPESQKQWLIENTTGDDTGENISNKNGMYNELTAVFWLWKNTDADYYGLMHYRRHFMFCGGKNNYYTLKKIKPDYFKKIGYSHETLENIFLSYDFICPKPVKKKSVYEHYKDAHDISDLIETQKIIRDDFPEFADSCDKYFAGSDSYFYNMFIFDRITFHRYCSFIFGVLKKLELRFENKRMFVSERLTGVFITKLISENKKGLFLPTMYIEKKIGLKASIEAVKKNLKERKGTGLKSYIYSFKPLLVKLLPSFVFRAYKNRK